MRDEQKPEVREINDLGKKVELIASGKAHTQKYLDWWKREPEIVNKLTPISASKVS